MKYAINVPNFGAYADPRFTAELAHDAEVAGWDGFFVWDHINAAYEPGSPMADPWVLLTAIALATERIHIGTMVTPLPRRRPWKLARETATLDRLSNGRLILGVGLGFPGSHEFEAFGEESDERIRAAKLDEGLAVLAGLWSGERFSFDGEHYQVSDVEFVPTPVQRPRIPIWVAQMHPHTRPLKRAARWDGLVPMHETEMFPEPEHIAQAVELIRAERPEGGTFDVCVPLLVPADRAGTVERVAEYESVGATWMQVGAWSVEALREQVAQGPPTS